MRPEHERRLLQLVVAIGGVVPVGGGAFGVLGHVRSASHAADSQVRYLSGLLLGIGLVFWACIPRIERQGAVVRVLGLIVVTGGLSRLIGLVQTSWSIGTALPLAMELVVTPLVVLWRERVERRYAGPR